MKALHPCLLFGTVAFLSANPASAQTPPSLSLQLFAGVNVTGEVGGVYVVQSTFNLSQSNSWTSVGFVQLPAANYLFADIVFPAFWEKSVD